MTSKELNDVYPRSSISYGNVRLISHIKVPSRYTRIRNKLLESLHPFEADIYILLLGSDGKRITEIADLIGIDRAGTHHIVSALQNKGLVTATFKHPIKFTAVPVDKAIKILSTTKNKYYAKIH